MSQPPRHIPRRTCVVCRTAGEKAELMRVVRQPDCQVVVDTSGKRPGRGAYLCRQPACWAKASKGKQLERALGVPGAHSVIIRYLEEMETQAP